jgi:hypothetical protein
MTDDLVAIRSEKAFIGLSAPDRKRLLAALSETQRHIKAEQQFDRYIDRGQRIRNRDALKAHLAPILKILADDVGGFDVMDWLADCHLGNMGAAMMELKAFENTAQRFLDGARVFKPDIGRVGRGELPLRADLTRRAFYEPKRSKASASNAKVSQRMSEQKLWQVKILPE